MLAFFKIEVVRLVVKTFLVLDRILYPAIIGYLSGTKIVVLAVTGYLSLVLPVTVKRDVRAAVKGYSPSILRPISRTVFFDSLPSIG